MKFKSLCFELINDNPAINHPFKLRKHRKAENTPGKGIKYVQN